MSVATDKRLSEIRAKIAEERGLLSELNDRISADLKTLLKPASHHLNDAEGWLAPEVLRHPPRADPEMNKWLDFVAGILDRAIAHRKRIEGLIKIHGPDARVVGGD